MDTHIPEGMQPMLHPHKRKSGLLASNGAGAMVVERDRSLGRAVLAVGKDHGRASSVLGAFKRFIRAGS